MTQLLTIKNDIIVIDNLAVTSNLNVTGSLSVTGESVLQTLTAGVIVTDTLHVKNLITDQDNVAPNTEWVANTDDDLNGRGFKWNHNTGSTQLIYRSGGRLWNSSSFDVPSDASYMIDAIPVITSNSLGSSIIKSNLRQVGQLTSLDVIGDSSIGGFAFFNTVNNRLGLGTSEPSASISIVDNNVEISIGSPVFNMASIGTRSNHDVAIISDNLPRLTVKYNGEVHVGNEANNSSVLRVFGSIYANNIVSDTRLERSTSMEFKSNSESTVYGKGLIWSGTGSIKQFIMRDLPDRFWSTESIDVDAGKSYYINNTAVLSETSLGESVTNSNLTSVGRLSSLSVIGDITSGSKISAEHINTPLVTVSDNISISNVGISVKHNFSIAVNELTFLYGDSSEIVIGNKEVAKTPVKVFGQLSVGINNPDPTVSLAVSGNISFNNKKFVTGTAAPLTGYFNKGDISWNDNPADTSYVGWVCVNAGNPGNWKPFGLIGA